MIAEENSHTDESVYFLWSHHSRYRSSESLLKFHSFTLAMMQRQIRVHPWDMETIYHCCRVFHCWHCWTEDNYPGWKLSYTRVGMNVFVSSYGGRVVVYRHTCALPSLQFFSTWLRSTLLVAEIDSIVDRCCLRDFLNRVISLLSVLVSTGLACSSLVAEWLWTLNWW